MYEGKWITRRGDERWVVSPTGQARQKRLACLTLFIISLLAMYLELEKKHNTGHTKNKMTQAKQAFVFPLKCFPMYFLTFFYDFLVAFSLSWSPKCGSTACMTNCKGSWWTGSKCFAFVKWSHTNGYRCRCIHKRCQLFKNIKVSESELICLP